METTDSLDYNSVEFEGVVKISKDLREASNTLATHEARFMVDAYYQMQKQRIGFDNRVREMKKSGEAHGALLWFADQFRMLEEQVKASLVRYVKHDPVGQWMTSITGIGPIIAAGFLAHIDIEKARTVSSLWRYCGYDPTAPRHQKGVKDVYNRFLLKLCFLLGESFVKVHNNKNDYYGKLYVERKAYETEKNERGDYAEYAALQLQQKSYKKDTDAKKAYEAGKLPPAHIHMRAKRYAVKIFISHLFHVWYWQHFHREPPKPHIIGKEGHTHFVLPPNWKQPENP